LKEMKNTDIQTIQRNKAEKAKKNEQEEKHDLSPLVRAQEKRTEKPLDNVRTFKDLPQAPVSSKERDATTSTILKSPITEESPLLSAKATQLTNETPNNYVKGFVNFGNNNNNLPIGPPPPQHKKLYQLDEDEDVPVIDLKTLEIKPSNAISQRKASIQREREEIQMDAESADLFKKIDQIQAKQEREIRKKEKKDTEIIPFEVDEILQPEKTRAEEDGERFERAQKKIEENNKKVREMMFGNNKMPLERNNEQPVKKYIPEPERNNILKQMDEIKPSWKKQAEEEEKEDKEAEKEKRRYKQELKKIGLEKGLEIGGELVKGGLDIGKTALQNYYNIETTKAKGQQDRETLKLQQELLMKAKEFDYQLQGKYLNQDMERQKQIMAIDVDKQSRMKDIDIDKGKSFTEFDIQKINAQNEGMRQVKQLEAQANQQNSQQYLGLLKDLIGVGGQVGSAYFNSRGLGAYGAQAQMMRGSGGGVGMPTIVINNKNVSGVPSKGHASTNPRPSRVKKNPTKEAISKAKATIKSKKSNR
jgi:hypothetical protein